MTPNQVNDRLSAYHDVTTETSRIPPSWNEMAHKMVFQRISIAKTIGLALAIIMIGGVYEAFLNVMAIGHPLRV